ncbi:MAG TPA: hypothetical protein VI454_12000, partial [Verrucomicrobiae bacterium]
MRKPALGRGLGQLLESRPQPIGGGDDAKTQTTTTGVRILLASTGQKTPPTTPVRRVSKMVLASLFAADALLCVLAYRIVLANPGAVGWLGWALTAAALVV